MTETTTIQTVVKEPCEPETFRSRDSLFEEDTTFVVNGNVVERSYEDRSVFFSVDVRHVHAEMFLNAEDALSLATLLIKHAKRSMLANMVNHQHIHMANRLKTFVNEKRVDKVTLTVVDERPVNYGRGFRTYLVRPTWKDKKAPEYEEDFAFETVIHFSPFDNEYKSQLKIWGFGKVPVEVVGYDRRAELEQFRSDLRELDKPMLFRWRETLDSVLSGRKITFPDAPMDVPSVTSQATGGGGYAPVCVDCSRCRDLDCKERRS